MRFDSLPSLVANSLLSGLMGLFLQLRCIPHQNSIRLFWESVCMCVRVCLQACAPVETCANTHTHTRLKDMHVHVLASRCICNYSTRIICIYVVHGPESFFSSFPLLHPLPLWTNYTDPPYSICEDGVSPTRQNGLKRAPGNLLRNILYTQAVHLLSGVVGNSKTIIFTCRESTKNPLSNSAEFDRQEQNYWCWYVCLTKVRKKIECKHKSVTIFT